MQKELVQNGKPVDISEYNEDYLKKACKLFSEGDQDLENVLYFLNTHNIRTFSCCDGEGKEHAFIALYLTEYNMLEIAILIEAIAKFGVDISIHNVMMDYHKNTCVRLEIPLDKKKEIYNSILELENNALLPNSKSTYYILQMFLYLKELNPKFELDLDILKIEDKFDYVLTFYTKKKLKTIFQLRGLLSMNWKEENENTKMLQKIIRTLKREIDKNAYTMIK